MWTQAWRRLHKKGKDEGVTKKKYENGFTEIDKFNMHML